MDTFERTKQIREYEKRVKTSVEEKLRGMPRTIEKDCGICETIKAYRILPFGFTGIRGSSDFAAYECPTCTTSTFVEIE